MASGDHGFLYREYSIEAGWMTPDPAGLAAVDPSNPQSWNRYADVENNPLLYVDPLGLLTTDAIGTCDDLFYSITHAECPQIREGGDDRDWGIDMRLGPGGGGGGGASPTTPPNNPGTGTTFPGNPVGQVICVIVVSTGQTICTSTPWPAWLIALVSGGGASVAGAATGISILDARANALAHAINNTGVQSLQNPCTVAGFYAGSAVGGTIGVAAANAPAVVATAAEEYPSLINRLLIWVGRWRPTGFLRGTIALAQAAPPTIQSVCSE